MNELDRIAMRAIREFADHVPHFPGVIRVRAGIWKRRHGPWKMELRIIYGGCTAQIVFMGMCDNHPEAIRIATQFVTAARRELFVEYKP